MESILESRANLVSCGLCGQLVPFAVWDSHFGSNSWVCRTCYQHLKSDEL